MEKIEEYRKELDLVCNDIEGQITLYRLAAKAGDLALMHYHRESINYFFNHCSITAEYISIERQKDSPKVVRYNPYCNFCGARLGSCEHSKTDTGR